MLGRRVWTLFLQANAAAQQGGSGKWWQSTGSDKRKAVPVPVPAPASEEMGLMKSALGFWRSAGRKLKDLEDKLYNQVCCIH
jgi:hypothetical protein